ncbi:MAG: hypothetical protein Kow00117_12620 [Phototrophicales bacterium]
MINVSDEQQTVAEVEETQLPPRVGFWGRLRQWVFPTVDDLRAYYHQQLVELDDAIALHPESPTNYLLRGEVYLIMNQPQIALADFEKAFELASEHLEKTHWGVVMQVVQDRAQRGLLKAKQRLWRDVNVR